MSHSGEGFYRLSFTLKMCFFSLNQKFSKNQHSNGELIQKDNFCEICTLLSDKNLLILNCYDLEIFGFPYYSKVALTLVKIILKYYDKIIIKCFLRENSMRFSTGLVKFAFFRSRGSGGGAQTLGSNAFSSRYKYATAVYRGNVNRKYETTRWY